MSPVKALRKFFAQIPELKGFSTQKGLADSIGRSESLVRTVELNPDKMSPKFAKELSDRFGIAREWLEQEIVANDDHPTIASAEGPLDFDETRDALIKTSRRETHSAKLPFAGVEIVESPIRESRIRDPARTRFIQSGMKAIQHELRRCPDAKLEDCLEVIHEAAISYLDKLDTSREKISMEQPIIVNELAKAMNLKAFKVIVSLIELDVFVDANAIIKPEIAKRVCERHGFKLEVTGGSD